MIKSALEIALEKTKDLQVDKKALLEQEAKTEGRKLAGSFLNNPEEINLTEALKKFPADQLDYVRTGIFEYLEHQRKYFPSARRDLFRHVEIVQESLFESEISVEGVDQYFECALKCAVIIFLFL